MLRDQLPSKDEHVILVRLSPLQRALYTEFMNRFREAGNSGWLGLNPLKAFCVCCKVSLRWLHWCCGVRHADRRVQRARQQQLHNFG